MNVFQYDRKKRKLFKAIVQKVNTRLQTWSPQKTERVVAKDGNDNYILMVHDNQSWTLFVQDSLDRIALDVHYDNGQVTKAGGIVDGFKGLGVPGRIIHINTVSNDHTLGMIDRLLAQLRD